MKYVKDATMPLARNKPFRLGGMDVRGHGAVEEQASYADAVWFLLDIYQPNPPLGHVLANDELRKKNKALAILEGAPQEEGYYRFEDADFDVMRKIAGWLGPYLSVPDYSPMVEDWLDAATLRPGGSVEPNSGKGD